jgi:hypothetical protein
LRGSSCRILLSAAPAVSVDPLKAFPKVRSIATYRIADRPLRSGLLWFENTDRSALGRLQCERPDLASGPRIRVRQKNIIASLRIASTRAAGERRTHLLPGVGLRVGFRSFFIAEPTTIKDNRTCTLGDFSRATVSPPLLSCSAETEIGAAQVRPTFGHNTVPAFNLYHSNGVDHKLN